MAEKFEYRSLTRVRTPPAPFESIDQFLAEHGEAGWELVTVLYEPMLLTHDYVEIFYLKRRL